MKRALAVFATCLSIAGTFAGVGAAGDHSAPGTPGEKNCVGQTTAWLAQLAKTGDSEGFRGFAGAAAGFGVSVQELKQLVQAFCAGGPV